MTSHFFTYEKPKVIQALRYHFITRKEIRFMVIAVNVFAIVSAVLFFTKKLSPMAFMIGSVLWFVLMISFWFILPYSIYKRSKTFLDSFKVVLQPEDFMIENDRGSKSWQWRSFSSFLESPHFFHLYFDTKSFFLIPKYAFDEEEVFEARKFFKEKIRS
jgi:hypothetical protein